MKLFNLMFITNDPELALHASKAGVSRVFVDLEYKGKDLRQGHLDTVKSKHTVQDVVNIKEVLKNQASEVLVRINPLDDNTADEIEQVISAVADIVMLPMFHTSDDVEKVSAIINKRAKFIPLVETKGALDEIESIFRCDGVDEVFVGLNDLHLDQGMDFIFRPLAEGQLEVLKPLSERYSKSFGFGGIARIGEGLLPAEDILMQHVRLGSSSVILSRTFHRKADSVEELEEDMSLEQEIRKILVKRSDYLKMDTRHILDSKKYFFDKVEVLMGGANV